MPVELVMPVVPEVLAWVLLFHTFAFPCTVCCWGPVWAFKLCMSVVGWRHGALRGERPIAMMVMMIDLPWTWPSPQVTRS